MEKSIHIFLEVEDNAAEFFEEAFWDDDSKPVPETSKQNHNQDNRNDNDRVDMDKENPEERNEEEDEKKEEM